MIKFISETDYFNGCASIRSVEKFSTRLQARRARAGAPTGTSRFKCGGAAGGSRVLHDHKYNR